MPLSHLLLHLADMDFTSAASLSIVQNPREPDWSRAVSLLAEHRSDDSRRMLQQSIGTYNDRSRDESLIAALRDNAIVGATLLRWQPGKTAQLWTPRLAAGEPAETAGVLVAAALDQARQRQCNLVQAVLEPTADVHLASLTRAGFEHFAKLLLLVCWLHDAASELPALAFELVPYCETEPARLSRIIELTYQETLDCPRLNGVRHIDDVIAGHRATGVHDPRNWYLVRQGGQDIGCLLLADHQSDGQWEMVYLGLAPSVRGRGYGLQLVQTAQTLARAKGAAQLVLAVDAANAPAIASYLAAGFVVWDRREVYLRILTMR